MDKNCDKIDDNISIKSSDSVTTSGEYEIVPETLEIVTTNNCDTNIMNSDGCLISVSSSGNDDKLSTKSPTLNIANNGDYSELERNLTEVIHELDDDVISEQVKMSDNKLTKISTITTATTSDPLTSTTNDKSSVINILPHIAASQVSTDTCQLDSLIITTTTSQLSLPIPLLSSSSTNNKTTNIESTTLISPITTNYYEMPTPELNKVGQSVFYDCIDLSPMAEKQDDMKPERSDTEEEMSDIDQDCTIFSGVTYLGASCINAPKSVLEIHRNMAELNAMSEPNGTGLKVSISIPTCPEGLVVLYDAVTNAVIAHYEVNRILFYARGLVDSVDQACFAFTWSHGDTQESAVFQCHIFKCHIPEAVIQVSTCFAKAFQRIPQSLTGSMTSPADNNSLMMSSITSDITGNPLSSAEYEFIVSLEIREKVTKNTFAAVPRDKSCFKLRCNVDKEVFITVKQTQSMKLPPLFIERCFGVLLSAGKLVRQADMQLLDMVSMGYLKIDTQHQQYAQYYASPAQQQPPPPPPPPPIIQSNQQILMQQSQQQPIQHVINPQSSHQISINTPTALLPYIIRAEWKANDKNFEQLNVETQKMFITVGVDLVIKGIQEPVRFVIETPVTIQLQNEIRILDHLLNISGVTIKKNLLQRFYLQLKENGEGGWEVNSIDPSEEIIDVQQPPSSLLKNLGINSLTRIATSRSSNSEQQNQSFIFTQQQQQQQQQQPPDCDDNSPTDYSSDGDEPLLSGTGDVSKDCSKEILDEWDKIILEWDVNERRPKNLPALVRSGIPETFRCKIWQKLANVENNCDITDQYRILITKETNCETYIQRDIHRTFPAHKFFRETGGLGQESLFKVSKAYAVYDTEVGYCQGLSFIAASLLLHMPEEEAFSVLVVLMYNYGLRDLYKDGFENLRLRLYQLDRLLKDQLPKLYDHFKLTGIETHMFASQWFLTLFTAKFPLYFVYHLLDVVLLDGIIILFQVAITLLSVCELELRQLDFEGILKYVRNALPKKCRTPNQARKMMKMACERKIKKLKQYEDEFIANKELLEKEELRFKQHSERFNEERQKMKAEIDILNMKLDKSIEKNKQDERKSNSIITDYKKIIQRQEQQMTELTDLIETANQSMSQCVTCSTKLVDLPNSPKRISSNLQQQENSNNTSPLHQLPLKQSQHQQLQQLQQQQQLNVIDAPLGPLDPLNIALQRVRELEFELAQTKLAHVEAECKNQDLNHQLTTTLINNNSNSSLNSNSNNNSSSNNSLNRNSWQPWLSKTINTIQEKVGNKPSQSTSTSTFLSYTTSTSTTNQQDPNQLNVLLHKSPSVLGGGF